MELRCVWLIFWLLPVVAMAEGTNEPAGLDTPSINRYTLFNPKPAALLRDLEPDRPDKTESPYTVDAGHFQLEMDFANYTYDKSGGVTTRAWNIAPFNLKAGLLDNMDIQFVYEDYLHVNTDDNNTRKSSTQSGVGDFATRLKINLWGDDDGPTAFALLPYVKFPTSTDNLGNDSIEGGIIFPLTIKLPADFDLSVETAFSCLRDESDGNHHADFINSGSLDHTIIGKLSGYVEFFSDSSTENHAGWVATIDTGLEFLVTKNMQLDCGCNFGVARAADNFNPFAGITVRF